MAPTMSTLNVVKPVRRVSFKPDNEVRYIDTESVDEKKSSKINFDGYPCYNIDDDDEVDLNKRIVGELSQLMEAKNIDDSMLTHDGTTTPWNITSIFKPAKSLNTPFRLIALDSMKKQRARAQKQYRKLQKTHRDMWTQPKFLKKIRQDWHHSDEIESDGWEPADNEMEEPIVYLKKQVRMTKAQRYCHQIENSSEKKVQLRDVKNFIKLLKNGEKPVVMAPSVSTDPYTAEMLKNFTASLENFLETNTKDEKYMSFKARAGINARLADEDIDIEIRYAYEVILDHYHDIMVPRLYHFLKFRKTKGFETIERMFFRGC